MSRARKQRRRVETNRNQVCAVMIGTTGLNAVVTRAVIGTGIVIGTGGLTVVVSVTLVQNANALMSAAVEIVTAVANVLNAVLNREALSDGALSHEALNQEMLSRALSVVAIPIVVPRRRGSRTNSRPLFALRAAVRAGRDTLRPMISPNF